MLRHTCYLTRTGYSRFTYCWTFCFIISGRMLRFTLLLLVSLYGSAHAGKYCCYPAAWESLNFFREAAIKANGTILNVVGEEMVSVDTTKNMVNSMASMTTGGQTTSIRTIQDWTNEKQYTIIGATCTPSPLQGPYPNKCVPDDAQLVAPEIDFGIMTHVLPVQVFQIMTGNVTSFVDIVKPDCIPMSVTSYGSTSEGTGMSSKLYTNVTLGIKDPSVFNIPDSCMKTPPLSPIHPARRSLNRGVF